MAIHKLSVFFYLLLTTLIMNLTLTVKAQICSQNGTLTGTTPPLNTCDYDCCIAGQKYPIYRCSPAVSSRTKAILTLNSFEAGGDGGGPSECDNQYHYDSTLIVALSTGWYNKNSRCLKYITINGNGRTVKAMVVDECDSTKGCDNEHGYQPPCRNNIVDGSSAVWRALGVPQSNWGELDVYWSDA